MSKRYIIQSDDDGHLCVIPADKEDEWSEYIEALGKYWSWNNKERDGNPPAEPEWVDWIGGHYSRVRFTDYEIE